MVNAVRELFALGFFAVDDKTKFDIQLGWNVRGEGFNLRQGFFVFIPVLVYAITGDIEERA